LLLTGCHVSHLNNFISCNALLGSTDYARAIHTNFTVCVKNNVTNSRFSTVALTWTAGYSMGYVCCIFSRAGEDTSDSYRDSNDSTQPPVLLLCQSSPLLALVEEGAQGFYHRCRLMVATLQGFLLGLILFGFLMLITMSSTPRVI
jgi:hypothetical protein